jgi:hypothetical protein
LSYVDNVVAWWPPQSIAAGMGIPGFAQTSIYNYVVLAFWLSAGPVDIAAVWNDPLNYFGATMQFGSTND